MTFLWVLLSLALLVGMWLVLLYNRMVRGRNLVAEAWSGIDVQLKRRADLIPNLLETVKGYMGHERGLLENLATLRARSLQVQGAGEAGQVQGQLAEALGRIFALAEAYPDLKASQNFQALQASLAEVEEQIQLARRYYNGAARDLNILVQSFPGNLVAGQFGFHEVEFFEIQEPAERAVPKVSFP
jgi:LemA protein